MTITNTDFAKAMQAAGLDTKACGTLVHRSMRAIQCYLNGTRPVDPAVYELLLLKTRSRRKERMTS